MANRFWVGGTGTWDASDTTHWAATSNGAGGQSVPGSSDAVTFDGLSGGGTVTVNTTVTILSLVWGAFTGTLDFATNDNNITMGTCSLSGTGTRTLNMGDGTWTITGGTSSFWDLTTATNLTLNCNGSTLLFSNTAPTGNRTFGTGAKTFNIVSIAAATTGFTFTISGAPTIGTLIVAAPVNLLFAASTTTTITNAFSIVGDATHVSLLGSSGSGGIATVAAVGGGTIQWAAIYLLTFTTGTVNATNSYDLRSNTGITITAPSGGGVVARVIGG